jgi:hypothetical protein
VDGRQTQPHPGRHESRPPFLKTRLAMRRGNEARRLLLAALQEGDSEGAEHHWFAYMDSLIAGHGPDTALVGIADLT